MNRIKIARSLQTFGRILKEGGFEAFLVGGAVRDSLLKKSCSDYDVATNATPKQVMSLFKHVIPTGIAHGTVTVLFGGEKIEVTTFRTDSDYSDGRHPTNVSFASTVEEDLSRRDFTVNAIAASLENGLICDPFNGRKDLQNGIIRAVGSPRERFSEDGLRPIRAIRFASKLGFQIHPETLAEIPHCLDTVKKISIERFTDEFSKILLTKKPSEALFLMEETGILQIFVPELCRCKDCHQGGFHSFDVMTHLFYAVDGIAHFLQGSDVVEDERRNLALAALFHDVGKPQCAEPSREDAGRQTFYGHENLSSEMANTILTRLRFPNATVKRVCLLIENHMFSYEPCWSDAAVRRFLSRLNLNSNPGILNSLFDLRRADAFALENHPQTCKNLDAFEERIEQILSQDGALSLKDLEVNGKDLIQMGITNGIKIGWTLNELLNTVLDSPEMNQKEKLLNLAKNLNNL